MPFNRQRLRDLANQRDRRCEICSRPTSMGALCDFHRTRRRVQGHPKMAKGLTAKEWYPILPAARRYIRAHPPTAEVLAAVGRLIEPGNPPPPSTSPRNPRRLLFETLRWWQSPASRKKRSGTVGEAAKYDARTILLRLVAAQIVIEEQDRRFPGASPEIQLVRVLAGMFRPRQRSSGLAAMRIGGSVRQLLAERLRQSTALGVYRLSTARALIAQRAVTEAKKATLPRKGPPPTTIYTPPPIARSVGGWPKFVEL